MPTAGGDVPTAAAYGFAVGCGSVVVRSPSVCYPLPGIAVEVVQAPRVRRFCSDRMSAAIGKVFATPGIFVQIFFAITKEIAAGCSGTGGVFPFGFCGRR